MNHFLGLLSPDTHRAFSDSDKAVFGFRARQRVAAGRIAPGDLLVCYLTRLSRWVGLLQVDSEPFDDTRPLFVAKEDPFVVRFKVTPIVWLPPEHAIPIRTESLWSKLSFTRGHDPASTTWTGSLRTSAIRISQEDGGLLEKLLRSQGKRPKAYQLTPHQLGILQGHRVRRQEGEVVVSVPDDIPDAVEPSPRPNVRESIKIQALLAKIGARMGFKIWIPAPDRAAVQQEAPDLGASLLEVLPLNYDTTTLKTIEYIDVLWLKGRSMARAFEVEHTTAVYSGILRMADLLALQPNMDIRLHIVAPEARKEKVFDEILRPVFSLLEGKPLAERCTYLDYDSVREISELRHLEHLSDSVLKEYEEAARM